MDSHSEVYSWSPVGYTCSSRYDGHPDRCGQSDDDDFTAATQCCVCDGVGIAFAPGHCACAAGWAGTLCDQRTTE
jgi:hypothetical protein